MVAWFTELAGAGMLVALLLSSVVGLTWVGLSVVVLWVGSVYRTEPRAPAPPEAAGAGEVDSLAGARTRA